MYAFFRRAHARPCAALAVCLVLLAPAPMAALPDGGHDAHHVTVVTPDVLTLVDARQRAQQRQQPLLAATQAEARADQALAVAAGRLPDPQLTLGIEDLPAEGIEAWQTGAPQTALMLGLAQEFPLPAKRRAQNMQAQAQARESDAAARAQILEIDRDVTLAWLDVVEATAVARLIDARVVEETLAHDALLAALRSGSASQADVLAATVVQQRVVDDAAAWRQRRDRAHARLVRWVGDDAPRDVPGVLPAVPALPDRDVLRQRLETHPAVMALQARVHVAQAGTALADAAYRPDWRLGVRYGHRDLLDDMVSLEVGMDLPLFTRNRQGQRATAAREQLLAASATRDDVLRVLRSALDDAWADAAALAQRLPFHEQNILAPAIARVDAALAGYRSAQSGLAAVIDARRERIAMDIMHIEMQAALLRALARLAYYAAEEKS